MKIKTASIDDAKKIHEIHTNAVKKTCKNFYTQKQINAWLEGRSPEGYHKGINKGEMYVVEDGEKIIGFGHTIPGEIVAIFVDPNFHKKGVGKFLLDYGLKIAAQKHKKIKVESTVNAENFYTKNGFTKIEDSEIIRQGEKIQIIVMEYEIQQNKLSSKI